MACTTILVGKNASYDGSTLIARNEDCGNGEMNLKKFKVVTPDKQPRHYKSYGGHLEIDLSDLTPLRYTSTPDAVEDVIGIWAEAGINAANVAMTATETITSNARVLGADPLVELIPAQGKPGEEGYVPEIPGGIGEEDLVTLVLPYIHSAREGVERLGKLLETYGTYEMNGIAFSDVDEIWYLETIGGHHWIARRVPDDSYVTLPNQLGIDFLDLEACFGEKREYMCSADLLEFVAENHLNLNRDDEPFNPRDVFGSHTDADHVYNTPRAWIMQRYLNSHAIDWDVTDAIFTPQSDDIPWCCVPEKKITIEDIHYILGLHYQNTPYDPYGGGDQADIYRPIGINRTCEMSILQIRPYAPEEIRAIQWLSLGCNVFNAPVAIYTNIDKEPSYVSNTTDTCTTENMYWTNRLIAALCDNNYGETANTIEAYQQTVEAHDHAMVIATDKKYAEEKPEGAELSQMLQKANEENIRFIKKQTDKLLGQVLLVAYNNMKNAYDRNDA